MAEKARQHVMVVAGTRPEAVKMAPVVAELRRRPEQFHCTLVSTGQHREMLQQAMNSFGLTVDIDLAIMQPNQTLAGLTGAAVVACDSVIKEVGPDIVLVQGDTTTVLAASLAAYYNKIAVGHVEAGLRTNDRYNPFPEEINRSLLSRLATFHFAPTALAARSLRREGVLNENVFVTGNTVVDALHTLRAGLREDIVSSHVQAAVATGKGRFVLVTCHRRESFGNDLEVIVSALKSLAERFPDRIFFFPVHLNPNVREQVIPQLATVDNIILSDPVPYPDILYCLSKAELVLTDSGGLQEEAPSFHVPVIVLRHTTERPEGIRAGFSRLVALEHDAIVRLASAWLKTRRHEKLVGLSNPYGDGAAAKRIVDILAGNCRHE